ncbi:MAG: CehA/McbA family metallohydrolase, partial [Methanomassiliicoccales archaeon]
RKWDDLLNLGIRKTAVGESDCKNADNTPDGGDLFNMRGAIGYPRNYIYAREFSIRGIIEAVRYGRSYVTDGPTMNFTVSSYIMGETIYSQIPRQLFINISGNAVENSDVRIISNDALIHSQSVGPGAFSISHSHMTSGDAYFRVEIRTFNGDLFTGETNIAFSNPVYFDITPYEDIPNPPKDLEAWIQGNDIVLNWTASNSSDVVHYYIYKSPTLNSFDFTYPHAQTSKTSWTDTGAGDGDINDYYYIVRAVDEKLYNDTNTITAAKHVQPLNKGWNLVSTPLKLSRITPGDVLQTVNDTCEIAQFYDPSDVADSWKDTELGDLTHINNTMGIWLYVNATDYLITAGTVPKTTVIFLRTGWNLVGYPSYTSQTPTDALGGIFWDAAQTYDSKGDFWTHSCPKKSGIFNDLKEMNQGSGYWIHATQDGQWTIAN